jgi:6-phosphogluconolactonase (cycloisomerase 2 family)
MSSIVVHPSGRFAYVTQEAHPAERFVMTLVLAGTNSQFTIRAPTGAAPTGSAMHPSGTFLYVANEGDRSISVYSINVATGELTAQGAPVATASVSPHALAIHPSGRLLLVAYRGYSSELSA